MIDIFLRWQIHLMVALAITCSTIVLLIDYRGIAVIFISILSLLLISAGQRLYISDTSENWLNFSWGDIFRSALGGVLLLFGWVMFLRGALAITIGSILLKLD